MAVYDFSLPFLFVMTNQGSASGWTNVTLDDSRVTSTGNELTIRQFRVGDEGVYQVQITYGSKQHEIETFNHSL